MHDTAERRQADGSRLTYYDRGRTPFFASQADPRFSYCLYVPEDYDEAGSMRYSLLVLVHGTERSAGIYRDRFVDFAARHDAIVLAPLFPANIGGPRDLDNYKRIDFQGIRFDRVLLEMVSEVAGRYRLSGDRFLMHGFSGGGHFAHRFFYLHPRRLRAVSVGAPGVVTLLDEQRDWWVGVRDLKARFGVELDRDAMRRVAVQMVIGGDDVETWEISITRDSGWWMEGAAIANGTQTRLRRMEALKRSWEQAGIRVRHDVVPGVDHHSGPLVGAVMDFFAETLRREA